MVQVSGGRSPPAELLPAIERGLTRSPQPSETFWYEGANIYAAQQMVSAGRIVEAEGYIQTAQRIDQDRLFNTIYLGIIGAMQGRTYPGSMRSWDDEMVDALRKQPVGPHWQSALYAAILYGTGDAEKLFAVAPADVPAFMSACARSLQAGLRLRAPRARLAAAKTIEACLMESASPVEYMQAASMLGDIDAAFTLFDDQEAAAMMSSGSFIPWFTPATKAMRADPRFLPLVQKLGYLDYWKQTHTQPDVCATTEERGIPLCAALRAG
jgi:hypothetical protein